jgi:lipopolysaccharide export system protein LptC
MNGPTTVSPRHERVTHAFTATSRGGGDRRFRAAVRHSRRVRMMRLGIPLGVLLVVGITIVVTTLLDPLRALKKLPVDLGNLVISGTKVTMQQPRIAGFTTDRRPYEVTARAAAQDLTNPTKVELQDIHAKTDIADQGMVEVSARGGIYDTKSEILTLRDDIVISSESGSRGRLSEAVIDVHSGSIVSEKPVQLSMLRGTLAANRMEITEGGKLLRFERGVTLVLTLGDLMGGKTRAAAP